MKNDSNDKGKQGEKIAAKYLRDNGYTILKMNFRCRFGEVDIISNDKKYIVFAEVKTRRNSDFAHAGEYVNKHKQRRIIKAAEHYLAFCKTDLQPRFDVIEIYTKDIRDAVCTEVNHIKNAFGV